MNAPVAKLREVEHPQLHKLTQLINAAMSARVDARRGDIFQSYAGKALVNAAFDLFECDDLYILGQDIEHDLEPEVEFKKRLCVVDRTRL